MHIILDFSLAFFHNKMTFEVIEIPLCWVFDSSLKKLTKKIQVTTNSFHEEDLLDSGGLYNFHCFGKASDSDHKFTRKAMWSFSALSNLMKIRAFVKTPETVANILRNIGWLLWNVKMMLCKYGKSFRLQHDLSVWPNSWKVRKHLHFNVKLPLEVHSVLYGGAF